jgi:dipeptidyl-peptidase 4
MKRIFLLICTLLAISSITSFAGEKITLEDIWSKGTFRQNYVTGLRSMQDGQHYTKLNMMRNSIIKVDYETGTNEESLFTLSDFPDEFSQDWIWEYEFDQTEEKILISTDYEPIYRHSFKANYYVYKLSDKSLTPIKADKKIQLAEFSPSGEMLAYVMDNNIYTYNLSTEEVRQITSDGEKNHIINGAPDWVYEEEFSFSKAWEWSENGDYIAFLKTDESKVKEFNMSIYGELYPEDYRYKYPKAGETNSIVSVHIYSLINGETIPIDLNQSEEFYVPRLKWSKQAGILTLVTMNRLQNNYTLHKVNAKTGESTAIINLTAEKYIELHDDLTFLPDKENFVLSHETDGYRHLYLYNLEGKQLRQITKGSWDITDFYGYDYNNGQFYFQAAMESPIQREVYRIRSGGSEPEKISTMTGTNSAHFSHTFDYYILDYTTANTPLQVSLFKSNGELVRVLENNKDLSTKMDTYEWTEKTFLTLKAEDGSDLNAWMIKPPDFKKNKSYPVLMYVYGGPGSQTVLDDWDHNMSWWQMLAQEGYIVVSVDNRGTGARGRDFRQITYGELGKYETQDLIAAANQIAALKYVDESRIGIFGWSYGGYMTNLCLTLGADVFSAGIAVAPVTNWRYYDSIYTERYNGLPQDNASGYDDNSPINHVNKLKGKLLLVHGSADDNVHYQNSMDYIDKLVAANKQFELMIYPNKDHGIYGGNTRLHLYTKMTNFLLENL